MIGPSSWYPWLVIACSVPALLAVVAIVYLTVKYSPVIARIFESQPLFMPLKVKAVDRGESVEFTAEDGVRLRGTYLPVANRRAGRRDRVLPRIPERPLEFPAVSRPFARPGVQSLHV